MNECKFEGCDREARTLARGLCAGHDWQFNQGKTLTPLRSYVRSDIGLEGYRRCNLCDEIKKTSEFYLRSDKHRYYSRCKRCHNGY